MRRRGARGKGWGNPLGRGPRGWHTWVLRDLAGPGVGASVRTLGTPQSRGEVAGGRAQPYLSRRSSGGRPGGGGCGVTNLSGSPFPRPTLGRGVGEWAWGAQDRPDLCDPGPRLSGEPVTSRRQVLPGLGQLWAAGCLGACKLINTATSLVAGDVRACGQLAPRG